MSKPFEQVKEVILVYDNNPKNNKFPKRLRFSTDQVEGINQIGLKDLNMIGSGAFNESQLEKITKGKASVIVVDLREESHGYINGEPICWYEGRNTANEGKATGDIIISEYAALSAILPGFNVPIAYIANKKNGIVENYDWHYPLTQTVMNEQQLIESQGHEYQRFFVTNHQHPSDNEVDRFLTFADTVPYDSWLYFHCRAGAGRTTTFMVMYDIIRTGSDVPLEDIIERHAALGGKSLFDFPEGRGYKYESAVERKKFLENFYSYVTSGAISEISWTEWNQQTRSYYPTSET
ncbi:MAG: hypothetical protein AAGG81_06130 [Chlamydiota bacterium]